MLKHLDLFSGIGGFTLAAEQVGGIQTTQFVECDSDAQLVLRDNYPDIPIHADIRDYCPDCGQFDLYTIGFPCTGTSNAGDRTGLDHPESKLWFEALRCVCIGQPRFVIVENPEGLIVRGLRAVLGGLRMAGYNFDLPLLISAQELGAPYRRNRVFVVAYSNQLQFKEKPTRWTNQIGEMVKRQGDFATFPMFKRTDDGIDVWVSAELDGVPIGVPARTPGRIRARYLYGRTVVPAQAAIALRRVLYLSQLSATVAKAG